MERLTGETGVLVVESLDTVDLVESNIYNEEGAISVTCRVLGAWSMSH